MSQSCTPQGSCDYVDTDMRDPAAILVGARTLDLTQPVVVPLIGVPGHVAGYGQARAIVAGLLGGLPAGSYLALGRKRATT